MAYLFAKVGKMDMRPAYDVDTRAGSDFPQLAHNHKELVADFGWQGDAAHLYAAAPTGHILREKGEQHIAEFLNFLSGVFIFGPPFEAVEFFVVEIYDFSGERG